MGYTPKQTRAYGRSYIEAEPGGSVETVACHVYRVAGPAWVGGRPTTTPGARGNGGPTRPAFVPTGCIQTWELLGSSTYVVAQWRRVK